MSFYAGVLGGNVVLLVAWRGSWQSVFLIRKRELRRGQDRGSETMKLELEVGKGRPGGRRV